MEVLGLRSASLEASEKREKPEIGGPRLNSLRSIFSIYLTGQAREGTENGGWRLQQQEVAYFKGSVESAGGDKRLICLQSGLHLSKDIERKIIETFCILGVGHAFRK